MVVVNNRHEADAKPKQAVFASRYRKLILFRKLQVRQHVCHMFSFQLQFVFQ